MATLEVIDELEQVQGGAKSLGVVFDDVVLPIRPLVCGSAAGRVCHLFYMSVFCFS